MTKKKKKEEKEDEEKIKNHNDAAKRLFNKIEINKMIK